jgi:hypothetical protein
MTLHDRAFWYDWRSTPQERRMLLSCDDEIPACDDILHRAIDVAAPAETLFRWLCQLKVAPYSYDWLDNLGRRSPRELTFGVDNLAVGDGVMTIFTLRAFEPGRLLTIRMTHPWGLKVFGDIAISYVVTPRSSSKSRLLVRMRMRYPSSLPFSVMRRVLPLGDWFMAQKQLRTFRALAEADMRRTAWTEE